MATQSLNGLRPDTSALAERIARRAAEREQPAAAEPQQEQEEQTVKSNQGKRIEIAEEQLIALHVNRYQVGESMRSIAKDLGISDVTMRQKFLDAGLPVARSVAERAWRPETETAVDAPYIQQEPLDQLLDSPLARPPAKAAAVELPSQHGQFVGEMKFAEALLLLQTVGKLDGAGFIVAGTVSFDLSVIRSSATPAVASR